MTIRLALTGTGWVAHAHARAARALDGVELSAVVNHRPESAEVFSSEFGIPRRYAQIAELLAAGTAEAVIVNTPNFLHVSETIAALQAGVHVLVEKPMALNALEAAAMVAASRASGAVLMVAHCWRFEPEVQWLRQQVAEGRLGRLIRTKGYGVHVAWGPKGWFTQVKLAGGGAMADMGVHAIDTTRYVLGDPRPASVYARIGTHYGDYDVDDTGTIIINWENDVTSYIELGWWQPHSDGPFASTQVYGTQGWGQVFPTFLEQVELNPARRERVESGLPVREKWGTTPQMFEAQLAHFLECVRTGRRPEADGEVGLVNLQIVDAAYESARTGEAVRL